MINVQSTTGSIANNYDNVLSAGWYCTWNGIGSTQPSIEGTHFNGCEFGSLFGIIWHYNGNLSQYSPPLLTFTNGDMNCQRSFVNARGISQLNLTTSTFELHEELEYGDAGFDFANVGGFEISHSMIFTGAAPGQSRATVVVGPGCNNGRISHIGGAWTGARNAAGIHFQPGSRDCSMNHVEVYTAGGAIYANAGTANIFDDASIRKPSEVPASIYTANIVFVGNNQQEQHIDFPLPPGKFAARPNWPAAGSVDTILS